MEDRSDIPELPDPWGEGEEAPEAGPAEPSSSTPGCGRPAVLGCGCLVVALGVLLILGIAASGRIVEWFLETTEETILASLPEEVDDAQRRELELRFDRFREGLETGRLRTQGLTELNIELTNAFRRAQKGVLEAVDIERLIEAFDRVLMAPESPGEGTPADSAETPVAIVDLAIPVAD